MEQKYQRFVEMNEEKRDDIIRATLKEFATYPYDATSINRILENADFSKGGLYYYFDGKQDLFIGVAEYILEYYTNEMAKMMKNQTGDVLQRFVDCGKAQSVIGKKYPYYLEFMFQIQNVVDKEEMSKEFADLYSKTELEDEQLMFGNIDESLLRDDISSEEAVLVIKNAMAGISKTKYYENFENMGLDERHDTYAEQVFSLLDILRKILYK